MIVGIICWIILGLIAGSIATRIVKRRHDDPDASLLLGLVGATICGGLCNVFSPAGTIGFNSWSLLAALCGAVALLVPWHAAQNVSRAALRRRV